MPSRAASRRDRSNGTRRAISPRSTYGRSLTPWVIGKGVPSRGRRGSWLLVGPSTPRAGARGRDESPFRFGYGSDDTWVFESPRQEGRPSGVGLHKRPLVRNAPFAWGPRRVPPSSTARLARGVGGWLRSLSSSFTVSSVTSSPRLQPRRGRTIRKDRHSGSRKGSPEWFRRRHGSPGDDDALASPSANVDRGESPARERIAESSGRARASYFVLQEFGCAVAAQRNVATSARFRIRGRAVSAQAGASGRRNRTRTHDSSWSGSGVLSRKGD